MKIERTKLISFLSLLLVLFVTGCAVSNAMYPCITDKEFEYYEKIALEIFEEYEKHILPTVPDDVKMRIDGDTILVGKKGFGAFAGVGYVEGTITRDEQGDKTFETKRVFSKIERVNRNIENGFKLSSIPVLVLIVIGIVKNIEKRKMVKAKNVRK